MSRIRSKRMSSSESLADGPATDRQDAGGPATTRRLLLRAGLALPATAGLAGCFGGAAGHTWWELDAPSEGGRAEPHAARAALSLVVEGVAAGALLDGASLLYSTGPGMRAPYQYASWAERPAARLARLAQRRLQARGGFRDVSTADSGVAPDLLLTLTLEQLHHDLSGVPGVSRESGRSEIAGASGTLKLSLSAVLTDWRSRRPMATRAFAIDEPVASADAAGAVAAAGRAAARLLDSLAPWVEASAVRA